MLSSFLSFSQIVKLDPAFPTRTEEVTITFDATQGSKGLVGVSQVYAHMGLIVTGKEGWQYVVGNWGTDDPRVKMTNIGNDKHTLKIKINEFYNVPTTEKIEQMTFVFRNVDGSKEGKTSNNQDIYLPFNENAGELVVNFISPTDQSFVAALGQVIPIKLQASIASKIQVLVNDVLVNEVTSTDLNYQLFVTEKGKKQVKVLVGEGSSQKVFAFSFITPPDLVKENLPANTKPGINITGKNTATLVLTAPLKKYVHLLGDFNNWEIDNAYALKQTPDEKYWWIDLNLSADTSLYTFQYLVDGKIRIGDPFSTLVLDGNNDRFISEENFPNMPSFPEGKATGYVSVLDFDQQDFNWSDENFEAPKKERLQVYELLVRDFVATRNYKTIKDSLDYLERLGINAIQLMPVQEFEGNLSWGYNPSFHMALDKQYGNATMLKDLVNECHRRGIAVILDVVYNHAFGQSPLVQMYWDATTGKPAATAIYANPDAKHPYNVGYDLNHESEYVKAFVDQVLAYWTEEFQIDGFRFDLSKGFTQKASTEATAGNYDASRIAILKRIASKVWEYNSDSYIIMEHFADNAEEKELAEYGMMLWANFNHAYNEATMGFTANGNSDIRNMDYKNRGWSVPHLMGYMESHDEERLFYKNTQFGNAIGNYSTKEKANILPRIAAAAHAFLPIPGPKMIWQFGELGFEYGINRCTDNTYNNACRLAEKPIRWDYLDDVARYQVYTAYATLAALRNKHEVFHTSTFTLEGREAFKQLRFDGDTLDAVVVSNFEMTTSNKTITFTHDGTWHELYSGDEISVSSTKQITKSFVPGEYRIYFDKKINRPDLALDAIDDYLSKQVLLFPNPASFAITIELPDNVHLLNYKCYDLYGKLVSLEMSNTGGLSFDVQNLSSGYYFIQMMTDKGVAVKAFLKD